MTSTVRRAALMAGPVCALLLAGCGGGGTAPADDPAGSSPDDGVVTLEPDPAATGSATGSPAPAEPSPGTGRPAILRAAVTAQAAVPGSSVVTVEDDDEDVRGWEVEAVRPDGATVEMVVAPGGGRVTLGPTPTDSDDDVAALLGQVRVGVAEAIRSAARTAPEGVVTAVQLEEEDGLPVWQVDLRDAGGVRVDAVTGESSPDD